MERALLSFVIPLAARENCKDWKVVNRCLERTLRCIYEQTISGARVILVASERPNFEIDDGSTVVHEYSPPLKNANLGALSLDKERRMREGLMKVRELGGSEYVMFVDADDLLHRRVIEFVQENQEYDGFVFDRGYVWRQGDSWLYPVRGFCQRCGSGYIFRYREEEVPMDREGTPSRHWMLTAHNKLADRVFERRGERFCYVPFPAGIYVRGHVDSIRQRWRKAGQWKNSGRQVMDVAEEAKVQAKRLIFGKGIDAGIRADFPGLRGEGKVADD